jgi:DNA-binding XRE family transcriptional regulator
MSPAAILKAVKARYPELKRLPKDRLRLVEQAIVFASRIPPSDELLTSKEHDELINKLGPPGGMTPGYRLRAYRYREELTQQELAKKSGISQANISAMEKDRRPIGLNAAKKLADILNCDYKRLV